MHFWPGSPTDGCVWVLEIPEGASVICVCFSVKCSIGFRGFPQDLSPTIKIHLIVITPHCRGAFLILFLSASYLHLPPFYHPASLPAPLPLSFSLSTSPQLSLSLSLSPSRPVYWRSSRLIASLFVSLSIFLLSPASLSSICLAAPSCLSMRGNIYFPTQIKPDWMFSSWPTKHNSKL